MYSVFFAITVVLLGITTTNQNDIHFMNTTTKNADNKKRLVIRIPQEFHQLIVLKAKKEHRSVNNYIQTVLRKAILEE